MADTKEGDLTLIDFNLTQLSDAVENARYAAKLQDWTQLQRAAWIIGFFGSWLAQFTGANELKTGNHPPTPALPLPGAGRAFFVEPK